MNPHERIKLAKEFRDAVPDYPFLQTWINAMIESEELLHGTDPNATGQYAEMDLSKMIYKDKSNYSDPGDTAFKIKHL